MARWKKALIGMADQIRDTVSDVSKREFLPVPRRDDDLFLVEFPKSGVTWLTFLIANINLLINNDPRSATLFNINDFVSDVHSVRYVECPPHRLPGYRIFKSHAGYLHHYRKVVYIVRDPRHVMSSYWAFLRGLGRWPGTLDELVNDHRFGVRAWKSHVTGWLDHIDAAASFTLVRYEDLLENPEKELERLYRLLGVPVLQEQIREAVRRSSIERLRELEAEFNSRQPALRSLQFFREGKVGGSREEVSESLSQKIQDHAGEVLARIGYPL